MATQANTSFISRFQAFPFFSLLKLPSKPAPAEPKLCAAPEPEPSKTEKFGPENDPDWDEKLARGKKITGNMKGEDHKWEDRDLVLLALVDDHLKNERDAATWLDDAAFDVGEVSRDLEVMADQLEDLGEIIFSDIDKRFSNQLDLIERMIRHRAKVLEKQQGRINEGCTILQPTLRPYTEDGGAS